MRQDELRHRAENAYLTAQALAHSSLPAGWAEVFSARMVTLAQIHESIDEKMARQNGIDIREYRLASLRRQIALVLQPPLVFPLSVRDNIAYGRPGADDAAIEAAARLACIDQLIAALPAVAPAASSSVPPLIVAPLVVPPDETNSAPPLLTVVPMAMPPKYTTSRPPLLTVVALAVAPEYTYSVP